MGSRVQLTQQRHTPSDPVLLGVVGGQRHGDHEVGGVARGGQSASPLTRLVQWSHIARPLGDV